MLKLLLRLLLAWLFACSAIPTLTEEKHHHSQTEYPAIDVSVCKSSFFFFLLPLWCASLGGGEGGETLGTGLVVAAAEEETRAGTNGSDDSSDDDDDDDLDYLLDDPGVVWFGLASSAILFLKSAPPLPHSRCAFV